MSYPLRIALTVMALLAVTPAVALCPLTPAREGRHRDVEACMLPAKAESWTALRPMLGVYEPQRFGRPGECDSPARKLVRAWSLLRAVELPGLGNAADYVDRQISSLAFDPGLTGGVRAQYVQGGNTLLLGTEFFDGPHESDAERAGTLLHEARHAADRRYKHVLCGEASNMAWAQRCDHRFIADPADPKAGAWSLEVTFHALLREARPCLDQELMQRRIEGKLGGAFRIVTKEQRQRLRALVKAAHAAS